MLSGKRPTRAVSLLLAVPIVLAAGFWFHRAEEREMRSEIDEGLHTIAQLKAEQLEAWRRERLGDAAVLAENAFLVRAVDEWLRDPRPEGEHDIAAILESVSANYGYADVAVVSPDGNILLSVNGAQDVREAEVVHDVSGAVADGRPHLADMHNGEILGRPHMAAVAPLVVRDGDEERTVAAVLLVCDARTMLDPILRFWPTDSETAETLLVRREGDDVVFLNDPRRMSGAALKLQFPVTRDDLPSVAGVKGLYGVVEGRDYRGVDVIADALPVPDSPWTVVAKIDAAEALAPLRTRSAVTTVIVLAAVSVLLAAVMAVWSRDQKHKYEALYLSEAALKASEERFGITLRSIGDAVITTDDGGNITFLNHVAEDLTGWTSEEAEGRPLGEVFEVINETTHEAVENPAMKVLRDGIIVGLANHTLLISRDGTEHPIADSGAPIRDGDNVVGVVLVFRDTTEEREAERRLEESLKRQEHLVSVLRAIRDVNQLITREDDREKLVQGACDCMTGVLGHGSARIMLLGADGSIEGMGYSGDPAVLEQLREVVESGEMPPCAKQILASEGVTVVSDSPHACSGVLDGGGSHEAALGTRLEFKDRLYGLIATSVPAEYAEDDDERGLFAEVAGDIAFALWKIESAQRRHEVEQKYSAALATTSDAVVMVDGDARIVMFNPGAERLLGYSSEEVLGKSVIMFTPDDKQSEMQMVLEATRAGTVSQRLETERITKDGRRVPVEIAVNSQTDEDGRPVGSVEVLRDITERQEAERALVESRRILNDTGRLAAVGGWEFDVETGAVTWTDVLFDVLEIEWSPRAPAFEKHLDSYLPESREALERAHHRALDEGVSFDLELQLRTPKRGVIWCRACGEPVVVGGKTAKLRGTYQDITVRKEAELDLERALVETRKREDETRALLDGARTVLKSSSLEDSTRAIFDRAREATGAASGFVMLLNDDGSERKVLFIETGDPSRDAEAAPPRLPNGLREHLRRDGTAVFENDFMSSEWAQGMPPGRIELRNILLAPLAVGGSVVGVMGLANKPGGFDDNDAGVSEAFGNLAAVALERSMSIEQLRESEEKYRLLADNVADCIWVASMDGILEYINPTCGVLFGYTPEEMIGKPVDAYCDEENSRKMVEAIGDAISRLPDTSSTTLETQFLRKDGTMVDVEVRGRVLLDEGGRPRKLQGVTRDITERKVAQAEQERLQTQLAQSQKMESVGQLAGGVAHDFNNMLQVILGNSELALMKVASDDALHSDLDQIHSAAERSADLTRQLLAFARKQTVAPRVMDLNGTVGGMLKMLQRLIGEDIDLTWSPASKLWPVKLDPSQVDQILANLCVNARDAIGGVGKVIISTANVEVEPGADSWFVDGPPRGSYVTLSVTDTGKGMDRETMDRIFDPFFTTKPVGHGTGLGLSTVYGIVRQNDGNVQVSSEKGQGTTFTVFLPRYEGSLDEITEERSQTMASAAGETVLVVEDESAILDLCSSVLSQLGYHVLTDRTPAEALVTEAMHQGQIDLLITDVIMPDMNGRELAKRIITHRPNISVLYMSGYTADVISRRGVLEDGVSFLQKPFSVGSIAAKVREALASSVHSQDAPS